MKTIHEFLSCKRLKETKKHLKFNKLDYIFLIAVTLFSLLITLFNLGSRAVPESYYKSENVNDYAVIKVEDKEKLNKIYVYYGIIQDEQNALNVYSIKDVDEKLDSDNLILTPTFYNSNMYSWQELILSNLKGEYLAFKLNSVNSYLLEIVPTDKDNKKIDFEVLSFSNANFLNAFDETDKFPFFPPSKTGFTKNFATDMYFDEIYHARTGFEHLNGIEPYEISHPPLGKVIMSCSIKIFGMNPFGYRIVGAVLSALSVSVLYFIIRILFNKQFIAYIGSFLYSLDGIRLSMGRIATLEGMVGFFVLLSYLFMLIFIKNNFFLEKSYKVYLPLFFSGLTFSISASIKWTGIYAGLGLLILLCYYIIERGQEYFYYKKSVKPLDCKEISVYNNMKRKFLVNIICILLLAFFSFIVVYLAMYILSYLPYKVEGETRSLFKIFLDNQKFMLSYHSGVTEFHTSQSHWLSFLIGTSGVYMFLGDNTYGYNMYSRVHAISNLSLNIVCLISLIYCVFYILKSRKDKNRFKSGEYILNTKILTFIFVGFLCNYLPWAFIDRPIFLYHFYNSMPFYICFACFMFNQLLNKKRFKIENTQLVAYRKVYIIVLLISINFILFYPLFTGLPITFTLANVMFRWVSVLGNGYGI